jgi:hypothetical protein
VRLYSYQNLLALFVVSALRTERDMSLQKTAGSSSTRGRGATRRRCASSSSRPWAVRSASSIPAAAGKATFARTSHTCSRYGCRHRAACFIASSLGDTRAHAEMNAVNWVVRRSAFRYRDVVRYGISYYSRISHAACSILD